MSVNGTFSFRIRWPAIQWKSTLPVRDVFVLRVVRLSEKFVVCNGHSFHSISATLNGEMKLTQSGHVVRPHNVSTAVALEQRLDIRLGDLDSIKNATSTVTHWFIDCQYVRETKDMKLQHIFNEPNRTHHIDALIEASFEPIPIKPVPTLKSKLISNWRTQHKADLPFICHNRSKITPDPNKVYGHFEANVTVYGTRDIFMHGNSCRTAIETPFP